MDGAQREMSLSLHMAQVATICRQYGVARLALFGSILRDDFTEDSDIDVLSTLAPDSPVHTLLDWIHLKQALEDLWHHPVDLVDPERLHPLIRDEVMAEERVIYVAPS
ncbi:DNA polymerase beta domain protein region [Sulfobacillus acidophilus TPY]|uniref:DNA polymerase beta domain protein region n=1 Tax=Sulfobacillus acidophilus (strain ATCC 700253 / DSM 10332 / NAL) TaxID=679936 RepID=G8TTS6_SULAD|nr:DNA polymerase beta domain protein region [Sulfobacillus acidophilus TPY]AEW06835.1 DNA polymerase beta domain protein region [Sulfobacillus acidophilus DSM 10332]